MDIYSLVITHINPGAGKFGMTGDRYYAHHAGVRHPVLVSVAMAAGLIAIFGISML